MKEDSRINNLFQSTLSFSNDTQEKSNNINYNKISKCKQKSMDKNSNNIIFNNYRCSEKELLTSGYLKGQNIKNNNDRNLLNGEKVKKKSINNNNIPKNNENNLNNKINEDNAEKNIEKSATISNCKKMKNNSVNYIFSNYTYYKNSNNDKNKDNNTKIFNDSLGDKDEDDDGFENFPVNNEDIDENKEKISIKKIPTENIRNIKTLYNSQNMINNGGFINDNFLKTQREMNKNIKRSCFNIDNNEAYIEDNNINQNNVNYNINIKNENKIDIKNNTNKGDDNNEDKTKNRNLSCKVKKKRKICVATLNYFQDPTKEKDDIILFENGLGVNDCFLNSIIQVLFHLEDFRNKIFQLKIKKEQNNPIFQLYSIFQNYNSLLKLNSIDTLNASLLRESLHHKYGTYQKGKCGDPMETISQILELIHSQYFQINTDNNNIFCQNELCPSHSNFLINLKEIKYCPICKANNIQIYDKDCFMYDVLSYEILSSVKDESFYDYKYSLFPKLKKLSQSFGDNKQRLEKCKCKEINTEKRLYLYNKFSPYLIINITWDTDFPKMSDICKIYGLIPIFEDNRNLFEIDYEKRGKTDNNLVTYYYLSSMILYGQNHYTCLFYNKAIDKWSFIDDDNKKDFNSYHELINYLIIRRSIPVGIIFYYYNDFKPGDNKKFLLNEKAFNKLYEKSLANDQRDMEEKEK